MRYQCAVSSFNSLILLFEGMITLNDASADLFFPGKGNSNSVEVLGRQQQL